MSQCGEHDGRTCDLPVGEHLYHHDSEGWWRNTAVQEAPRRRKGRKRRTSSKASPQARARALAARDATAPRSGPRPEWDEESWVTHARQTLRAFLAQREDPFTTPEHVWPLLPDPAPLDRRVFSRVVQAALREGWMAQDGAVRLEGGYVTADGTYFDINKIVPVYRSLLC